MGNIRLGFTLIELLTVMAIVGILCGITIGGLSSYHTRSVLLQEVERVVSTLEQARSLTLSSKEASQYGVHIETAKVVRFQGNSYVSGSPNNRVYDLDPKVTIGNISLAGNSADVVFKRLTGETDQAGQFTIQSANGNTVISIGNQGTVSY